MTSPQPTQLDLFQEEETLTGLPNTLYITHNGERADLGIEEIFDSDKYQHLIAITYSVSGAFINEYLSEFDTVDIVIGIDNEYVKSAANKSAQLVQDGVDEQISKRSAQIYKDLNQESRFHLAKKQLNVYASYTYIIHTKLYLLWNDQGETRVITGSANLSKAAFEADSIQFELIHIEDNSPTFNDLKKHYTQDIRPILTPYTPKEIIKINTKAFKSINAVEEINVDQVVQLDNDTMRKVVEQAPVDILDSVNHQVTIGVAPPQTIVALDEMPETRSTVQQEQVEAQKNEKIAYEIVKESINKRSKKPKMKTKQTLRKNIKKRVEPIVVKQAEVTADLDRVVLYNEPSTRDTNKGRSGLLVPSTIDKKELLPFGKKATLDEIKTALHVLDQYMSGFEEYAHRYNDEYGMRVFESILTIFSAPFIYELRQHLDIPEHRIEIPQFIFIGGDAGSGKSSLLAVMSKLTGINKGQFYQWVDLLGTRGGREKVDRIGYINHWITENNVNPILIDEIDSEFFEKVSYGRDFIVNTTNQCINRNDSYPIVVGTTNTKSFTLPQEASRRSYYLVIDKVMRKTKESAEFFKDVFNQLDDTLFLDFCLRLAERLENHEEYDWNTYVIAEGSGDGSESVLDFLYHPRQIFKEYYEEVGLPLPAYFPEHKHNDDAASKQERWRTLYLGSREDFSYNEENGYLYYEISKLNQYAPVYGVRPSKAYEDALLPQICATTPHEANIVTLYTQDFFDWIDVDNPYAKKPTLMERVASFFTP